MAKTVSMKTWWQSISKTDIRNLLAVLWVLSTVAFQLVLMLKPLPSANNNLLNLAIGSYLSTTGMVMSYFFGSSKTENDKSKTNTDHIDA